MRNNRHVMQSHFSWVCVCVYLLTFMNSIVLCCLWVCASLSMNAPGCPLIDLSCESIKVSSPLHLKGQNLQVPSGPADILMFFQPWCPTAPHFPPSLPPPQSRTDSRPCSALLCSDGGMVQSQDDSIVGTKQCRHSVAIMPIPGNLSSSSPDLLQPATSVLDFPYPGRKTHRKETVNTEMIHLHSCVGAG